MLLRLWNELKHEAKSVIWKMQTGKANELMVMCTCSVHCIPRPPHTSGFGLPAPVRQLCQHLAVVVANMLLTDS